METVQTASIVRHFHLGEHSSAVSTTLLPRAPMSNLSMIPVVHTAVGCAHNNKRNEMSLRWNGINSYSTCVHIRIRHAVMHTCTVECVPSAPVPQSGHPNFVLTIFLFDTMSKSAACITWKELYLFWKRSESSLGYDLLSKLCAVLFDGC